MMEADTTECYYYSWWQIIYNHVWTMLLKHMKNKSERCFVFLSKTLLVLLKIGSKIR